jgi:pimeloyl-ACP methyl ester carboxylesterase
MRRLMAVVAACWFVAAPARAAGAIDEQSYVPIGGIAQWITVKGQDRANPVLLLLHGGPAVTFTPQADANFKGWDKDFTLVDWDQRGAGRTFAKNGGEAVAATMTMARMIQDGIEVAQYAARHLGKKKVILMGASWGSILGIQMIHARPDLFSAYVGPAQIVDMKKNTMIVYARLVAMTVKDRDAASTLARIGPPPWHEMSDWRAYQNVEQVYQRKLAPRPPDFPISPAYASAKERAESDAAVEFSARLFMGAKLDGPLATADLPALGMDFSVPVFVIQGERDMTALPELARAYVDDIKAPAKKFFLLPGAGHAPGEALWALTHKVLMEDVRPLAR